MLNQRNQARVGVQGKTFKHEHQGTPTHWLC